MDAHELSEASQKSSSLIDKDVDESLDLHGIVSDASDIRFKESPDASDFDDVRASWSASSESLDSADSALVRGDCAFSISSASLASSSAIGSVSGSDVPREEYSSASSHESSSFESAAYTSASADGSESQMM